MDRRLMGLLVCPICKGELTFRKEKAEMICFADALAFPVRDGIPVMLEEQARTLTPEEREQR